METKHKEGDKRASELFTIKGDWGKQSETLKLKYPQLSNEDVKFEMGKEIDLIKRLETKLNKNRNQVIDILKSNYKTPVKA